jgi:hypothetical protein
MSAVATLTAKEAYAKVRDIGLAFPGADVKLSHGAPSFHVRGKMFLTFVDNHHGDGRLAVWCKAVPEEQKRLVEQNPARFFVPPYVGVGGWVGVRLDEPAADWIELAILVEDAWTKVAPKSSVTASRKPASTTKKAPPKSAKKPLELPTTDAKVAAKALAKLTELCATLPESWCERAGTHATFRVRGRPFVYFLDNHHGDEIISVAVKVDKREQATLVRSDPKRYYLPAYIGAKGWIAIRLDVPRVDWKDVAMRVSESHAEVSPPRGSRGKSRPRA